MIIVYISVFLIALYLLIIFLIHRRDMNLLCSVSSPDRGTISEQDLVIKLLKKGVYPKAIFHDLYVRKRNGEYSQIDLVVALPQGLVCIEVKDYSGWIYGFETEKYWLKSLNHGKEQYKFYNPLMQNEGHIRALREQSRQFARLPIFNVVVFAGDCELTDVRYFSDDVFIGYVDQVMRFLKQIKKKDAAAYTDKREVARLLRLAVQNGDDPTIQEQHLEKVNELIYEETHWWYALYKWFRRTFA